MDTEKFGLNDQIIVFIGGTGCGMSTIIDTLCPRAQRWGNESLGSGTQHIQWIRACNPITKDNNLVLVDTPGFNGDEMTVTMVLDMVSEWASLRCPKGMKLSGIVFVHRINDNRLTQVSISRVNLGTIKRLCGERALENVLLVTSMWNRLKNPAVGETREKELEAGYWADMIKGGAHSLRFDTSEAAAWRIVQDILEKQTGPTLEELHKFERRLSQTKVGQDLLTHLQDLRVRQSVLIPTIASRITVQHSTSQTTLDAEQGRLEADAQRTFKEIKSLKPEVSFGDRILKFFSFGWKPHKRQLPPKN